MCAWEHQIWRKPASLLLFAARFWPILKCHVGQVDMLFSEDKSPQRVWTSDKEWTDLVLSNTSVVRPLTFLYIPLKKKSQCTFIYDELYMIWVTMLWCNIYFHTYFMCFSRLKWYWWNAKRGLLCNYYISYVTYLTWSSIYLSICLVFILLFITREGNK